MALNDSFASGIWLTDLDEASNPRQITRSPDWSAIVPPVEREGWLPIWAAYPTWAPDGTALYFLTNRDGRDAIWTVSDSGGDERYVWSSPASERFTFCGLASDGCLAVCDKDGLKFVDTAGTEVLTGILSATTYWTSDYSGVAVLDPIQNTVWLLGPDHSCTGIPKLEDGYRLDPCVGAWSPDGSRFAFYVSASGSGEQGSTLAVVSRSGSEASLATYGPPDGFRFSVRMFPSFADDSTVLAIVTRPEGSSDIYETWGMNLCTH